MSRRFAVGANPMTPVEKAAIREWLSRYRWWNWIDGFWLIRDSSGDLTVQDIRDSFRELAPNAHVIVIEIPSGGRWSGYGPKSGKRNMFKWMKGTWDQG